MSLMDIECSECISLSTDGYYINTCKDYLLLGENGFQNYIIYLYFKLPSTSYLEHLERAELILFKLPEKYLANQVSYCSSCSSVVREYNICPLIDFFSIYNNIFGSLKIDCNNIKTFEDMDCYSYNEIDVTDIINAWKNDNIENRGLLLMGSEDARLLSYTSYCYSITSMRPKLRIIYKDNDICEPLSKANCSIDVIK